MFRLIIQEQILRYAVDKRRNWWPRWRPFCYPPMNHAALVCFSRGALNRTSVVSVGQRDH